MMTENYVSFETAKLLKKKGFSCDEISCINVFKGHTYKIQDTIIDADEDVTIPTIQMAMKWLREVHNFHCNIGYDFRLGWNNKITSLKETVIDHDIEMKTYLPYETVNYPSYEEACEAAIRHCLQNLI